MSSSQQPQQPQQEQQPQAQHPPDRPQMSTSTSANPSEAPEGDGGGLLSSVEQEQLALPDEFRLHRHPYHYSHQELASFSTTAEQLRGEVPRSTASTTTTTTTTAAKQQQPKDDPLKGSMGSGGTASAAEASSVPHEE